MTVEHEANRQVTLQELLNSRGASFRVTETTRHIPCIEINFARNTGKPDGAVAEFPFRSKGVIVRFTGIHASRDPELPWIEVMDAHDPQARIIEESLRLILGKLADVGFPSPDTIQSALEKVPAK